MAEPKKELIDREKPHTEAREAVPPRPEMLETVDAMQLVADMLKEEGVKFIPYLTSGSSWGLEIAIGRAGIQKVHVRNEMTATFAMDAAGRVQGTKPGVAVIGSGTGMCNSTAGVVQAFCAQSPGVVICSEHPMSWDRFIGGQGIVMAEYLFQKIAKDVKRTAVHAHIPYEVKNAFRQACTPPTGPTVIAIPYDFTWLKLRQPRAVYHEIYADNPYNHTPSTAEMSRVQADPQLIDKTMRWIMEAEKPAVIVGEAVSYDDAEAELQEFVKMTGIPTHCRRNARGAIDEYDRLNCCGRARGRVMREADRAVVFGLKIGYLENLGLPPFWGAGTRHVQMQSCRENVSLSLVNTEWEVLGSAKFMLRQMIDWCQANGITKPPEKWNDWRKHIEEIKQWYYRRTVERTEKQRGKMPLHPDLVGRIMAEFLHEEVNEEVYTVIDGFTASSYFTDWQRVRHSRHNLDASDMIGIGHGPGMALGAGLATNRQKPIFVLLGDGAIGAGGMDIETCCRWDIPAVFVHENNSGMVSGGWKLFWSKSCSPTKNPMLDAFATLPDIRYDKMMAEFGCHTEFVERDAELRPALKRALDFARDKSKPAFVEVFVDPDVLHEIWYAYLTPITCAELEWDEIPEEGQEAILREGLIYPGYVPFCTESVRKAYAKRSERR